MQASCCATDLELRVGQDPVLLAAAQKLHYRVFYEKMGAEADPLTLSAERDADAFDGLADHLVVVDRTRVAAGDAGFVGCYRLLRGPIAATPRGFYSSAEFDLGIFADRLERVVELGR